jgi:hypothetical protein
MPTVLEFLTPVLVLVAWTFVMWFWLYATRSASHDEGGHRSAGRSPSGRRGAPYSVARALIADNYNHLHEQPTVFYALMFFAGR